MIRTQRNSHLNWHEKRNYHYRYLSKVGLRIFEYSYLSYKKFSSLKAGTYVQAQQLVRPEHVKATTWKRKQGSVNLEATTWKRQLGSDNLERGEGGGRETKLKIQKYKTAIVLPKSPAMLSVSVPQHSPPFIFNATTWKRLLGSDKVEATKWKRQPGSDNLWPLSASVVLISGTNLETIFLDLITLLFIYIQPQPSPSHHYLVPLF